MAWQLIASYLGDKPVHQLSEGPKEPGRVLNRLKLRHR
jgi:hypothetical protein